MKKIEKKDCFKLNISRSIYFCSFFMLLFVFSNIFLSSVLFFFKISINYITPIVSFILSIIGVLYAIKKHNLKKWYYLGISLVLPIVLICLSLYASGTIYDFTYDGNSYQKATIGQLKNGWNPVYEDVEDFDKDNAAGINIVRGGMWINHYAKGSHTYAANIYALTGNIETGKSINIISILILFGFVLSLLIYKNKSWLFSIVFGICVVTYPVVSAQYLTNYVDLLLYIYVSLVLLSFFYFEDKNSDFLNKKLMLCSYFMFLVIAINIKFTSFAYCGIFCLGYFIWYLVRLKLKTLDLKFFKHFTIISIIAVIVGTLVVGYGTYTKNLIDHSNPFYPLIGKDKIDIMTVNSPDYFKGKNSVEKFAISTFSGVANIYESMKTEAQYKYPFTILPNEIKNLYGADTRISGNGIYFGGIFLVAIMLLLIYSYKGYKKNKRLFFLVIIPILITLVMVIFLSESWWARYFPQIYFVVLGALVFCNEVDTDFSKGLMYMLMGVLLLNNFHSFFVNTSTLLGYNREANVNFQKMEDQKCKYEIYGYEFPGAVYNVIDKFGYDNIIINIKSDADKGAQPSLGRYANWRCSE